ncbi:MAG: MMPL family transporter [Thermoplasmataceae archaeon]
MSLSEKIIKRRLLVVIIWVILILASTPAVFGYSHFISYNNTTSVSGHAESEVAQQILQNSSKQNSTIEVLVNQSPYSGVSIATSTLNFQKNISKSGLKNISGTSSPFSQYASFMSSLLAPYRGMINSSYDELNQSAYSLFTFPYMFMVKWGNTGFNSSDVNSSAYEAGLNSSDSPYNVSFVSNVSSLSKGYGLLPSEMAYSIVNKSISVAAMAYRNGTYDNIALEYMGITNYTFSTSIALSDFLNHTLHIPVSSAMINASIKPGNVGLNYVRMYGLKGAPSFISEQYIDTNGTAFIIDVTFNVPSGYIGPSDFIPSSAATPAIEKAASRSFGSSAYVTGNGPIQYETQQLTAKYAFVFGVLFVILAIAVAITLVSWKAGLVAFAFVGAADLLGYTSIYLSGLLLHHINYIVNYTLTAVAVGVVTDYLVFIASRYRQDLREGRSHEEALKNASSKAGKAVIISGLTVGLSLFTFSFIKGFESWGVVLLMAILFIVAFVTTLLPAVLSLFGPKFFSKRSMKRAEEGYYRSSPFYRAATFSKKRKYAVLAVILIVGVPSAYFFVHAPTTYNFNTGLPQNLDAVKGLNILEKEFGSNLLYPIEVVEKIGANGTNTTSSQNATLEHTSRYLLSMPGITKVIGPYSNGTTYNSSVSAKPYIIQDGKYAYFLAFSDYNPYSSSAEKLVGNLRANSSLIIGGITSSVIDQKKQNSITYTELEILIIAVIFVILLASFRSPKYPIISISGVFFSISWTTVILYFLSAYVLHEGLIYLIPIILFIILMALGNDYTVFITSRVREYSRELGFEEGMPRGMASSGKVVTSLGLILAVSLGSLGLIKDGFLQQLGIAFLISLVIDTFIVRTFYFPAMLSILRRKGNAK